ncbi:hypothetical protein DLM75_16940 [Leptospira stimsonii]|uniref:Uncharacterized protein n=1 Tax=Leptospira stimsonii TaxID=2202203 RepID=A0A396YX94_9LEPT|nr:hypothetical protein DLM75_16940 [Leptospira stimsonii]
MCRSFFSSFLSHFDDFYIGEVLSPPKNAVSSSLRDTVGAGIGFTTSSTKDKLKLTKKFNKTIFMILIDKFDFLNRR